MDEINSETGFELTDLELVKIIYEQLRQNIFHPYYLFFITSSTENK